MRNKIIITCMLVAPHAYAASCHHYSKWLYPYPQPKCSGVYARTTSEEDKSWYVEITKLPSNWEEDERQQAIEKLKEQLNGGR